MCLCFVYVCVFKAEWFEVVKKTPLLLCTCQTHFAWSLQSKRVCVCVCNVQKIVGTAIGKTLFTVSRKKLGTCSHAVGDHMCKPMCVTTNIWGLRTQDRKDTHTHTHTQTHTCTHTCSSFRMQLITHMS